jgi:tRNA nucleotidyltransferase (CCA-adding enzyme)
MRKEIPEEVKLVVEELEKQGFEAYIVGGCVRDLLLEKEPEDWDVTTNAKPEEIQKLFPNSFYENKFFTVTVLTESEDPKLKEIEITTYRSDEKYADRRRPEEVKYASSLQEDLSRRDFTVNALALAKGKVIDPFEGQKDLKEKMIRAVGDAETRFDEDALRMMRAARLATTLEFTVEKQTHKAIQKNAQLLKEISQERIQDEFVKIVLADRASEGIELLRELKLLPYIMPELEEGYGVKQNKHHTYTVWEHNLFTLKYAAEQGWSLEVRLASLLHDVAKPRVKKGEGQDATFYNHEIVGANMTAKILERLKFSRRQIEYVAKLVRLHMFYYNVDEVKEASVRRLVAKLGAEHVDDLLQLRMADRIGSGVPKAQPYKLRHWKYMIDKVSQDPLSPKMLKVSGSDIMEILGITPGPKVGFLLAILLGEVLDDPRRNTQDYLTEKVREYGELPDEKLRRLAVLAKEGVETLETEKDKATKQKYWVE